MEVFKFFLHFFPLRSEEDIIREVVGISYLSKGSISPDWVEKLNRKHQRLVYDTIIEIRTEENKQKEREYKKSQLEMKNRFKS